MHHESYVYIMTNVRHTVLYTGVTNDIVRRAQVHCSGKGGAFTTKYRVTQLVYVEEFNSILDAIAREKTIKAGSRKKKVKLIASMNPEWKDLLQSKVPSRNKGAE